jgi:hypothetical protein
MTARERKARSFSEPRTLRFAVAPVVTFAISRASWSSNADGTPMHRRTDWTATWNRGTKDDGFLAATNTGSKERSLTQIMSRRRLVKSRSPCQSPRQVVG